MAAAAKKLEPVPDKESGPVFTFTPTVGEPIEFPTIRTVVPDKAFLWKLHKMNFLSQTWEWMDKAGIPADVQERVVDLPDEEYSRLFNEWFAEVGTAGE